MFETYFINNIEKSIFSYTILFSFLPPHLTFTSSFRYFYIWYIRVSTKLKLNNELNPSLNLPRQSEPHQYNLVAALHSYTYNTSSNLPIHLSFSFYFFLYV